MPEKCLQTILVLNWDQRLRDNRQNWTFVIIFSQVISRRGKNENVCEMSKNEKCTCKVCKAIAFHLPNMQVCDTDKFLIFSSNRCYKFSSMIIGTQFSSITSWNYCRNEVIFLDGVSAMVVSERLCGKPMRTFGTFQNLFQISLCLLIFAWAISNLGMEIKANLPMKIKLNIFFSLSVTFFSHFPSLGDLSARFNYPITSPLPYRYLDTNSLCQERQPKYTIKPPTL